MPTMRARLAPVVLLLALGGCAGLRTVGSDVSSFGDWPAGRAPGTFAIERLPSQKMHAERQDRLESGARDALQHAGFSAAADPAQADVIVQIGARITRTDFSPWDDPLWWRWGPGYWRHANWRPGFGPAWGPGWGWYDTQYDQEVGVLIRDRRSGTPLYEARASKESMNPADDAVLGAMFVAALRDFPNAAPQSHRVQVELAPQ